LNTVSYPAFPGGAGGIAADGRHDRHPLFICGPMASEPALSGAEGVPQGTTGGVVQYLLGDHLHSTSLVLDQNRGGVAELRYRPYGEERWPQDGTFPTAYRFTGQREEGAPGLEPLTSPGFADAADRPERFPKPFGSRFVGSVPSAFQ